MKPAPLAFNHNLHMEEPAVPLRIGLHIGEVVYEGGKIMGDGVEIFLHAFNHCRPCREA